MRSRKQWIQENKKTQRPIATREFTDRIEFRQAYHDMVSKCKKNDTDDVFVMNFYGIGGIGKTTLLHKLQAETLEKNNKAITVYVDLSRIQPDVVSILLYIERNLRKQRATLQFTTFDIAITRLSFLRESKQEAQYEFCQNPLLKQAFNIAGDIVPEISKVTTAINRIVNLYNLLRNQAQTDRKLLKEIESYTEDELIRNLPLIFANDLNVSLQNYDEPIYIFIDTYECLVSKAEGTSKWHSDYYTDSWLYGSNGLIRNLPSTIFVIAGRERLIWNTLDQFWENKIDMHLVNHLSEKDSNSFYASCHIPALLWHPLYQLTGGEPVYMDLCVSQYENVMEYYSSIGSNKIPTIDEFGENTESLVERYTRYIPEDMLDLLYLAAILKRWSTDVLYHVAEALHIPVLPIYYQKLTSLTFVEQNDDEHFTMHSIISAILARDARHLNRKKIVSSLINYHANAEDETDVLSEPDTLIPDIVLRLYLDEGLYQEQIADYLINIANNSYDKALSTQYYEHALECFINCSASPIEGIQNFRSKALMIFTNNDFLINTCRRCIEYIQVNYPSDSHLLSIAKLQLAQEIYNSNFVRILWQTQTGLYLAVNPDYVKSRFASDGATPLREPSGSTSSDIQEAVNICMDILPALQEASKDEVSQVFRLEQIANILTVSDDIYNIKTGIELMQDTADSKAIAHAYARLYLEERSEYVKTKCLHYLYEAQAAYDSTHNKESKLFKRKNEYEKAASEVLNILYFTDENDVKKIPTSLLFVLYDCSAPKPLAKFDFTKSLEMQDPSEKAQDILAMFYVYFWASADEKHKLIELANSHRK